MNSDAVRAEAICRISALLLGPIEPNEVIASAPADTYLTGILWPQGSPPDAADDDTGSGAGDQHEEGADFGVPGYRAVRPCSVGLTFTVDAKATVTVSLGETARYVQIPAPAAALKKRAGDAVGTDAKERPHWRRMPLSYRVQIPPDSKASTWRTSTFEDAAGVEVQDNSISLHIRKRPGSDLQTITVTLINVSPESEENEHRDLACLFQAGVIVTATGPGGQPAIHARRVLTAPVGDEDAQTAALLYRDVCEFAIGHGVAASWPASENSEVELVRTDWLPQTAVKGTSAAGHALLESFAAAHPTALSASFLSNANARMSVITALDKFVDAYFTWIGTELKPKLGSFEEGMLNEAGARNFDRCEGTAGRLRAGVRALESNDQAWTAFALANEAMDRQSRYPAKEERARALVWRPFQLAFMLLVIPGLIDPADEQRDCMDLLWFPTGGGKTEAYLGLTAFQIFYVRLTTAERREQGGVDVIMRYTLRLLTVQQFQRAAALITACEAIRREDVRLGIARITLGLYVGGDATPNRMEEARAALAEERNGQGPKSTPRQLLRCPVCGADLHAPSYRASPADAKIDIVCEAKGCDTNGYSLPVITVDEAIYASPPSLLIGTVDKFAQLPRSFAIRQLFGLGGELRPGLIIQDELHLISGPLGSMAGLYETAVDLLCTKEGVRPKVIGSTATIGQAARQVRALFDRTVLQFPPPGFNVADSFFAVRDEAGADRIYIGACSAGRSPKFALQAVIASLLQGVSSILTTAMAETSAIDPYWTCVTYFNSLRELGGADVLMQDDVPRQMAFLASRLGVEQRILEMPLVELSSRVSSRDLPALLQSLETPLNDDCYAGPPKDTVLASNMISVGVDVPRLGLMVVNGQPKSTAEYIQASSRVGRGIPGLVVTLYNFGRPRDLSHYEHFCGYHSALYRSVEATSVTPWAPRARDKALHAVVIATLRHLVAGLGGDGDAGRFNPDDPEVMRLLDLIRARVDSSSHGIETDDASDDIAAIVERWSRRSHDSRVNGTKLNYWERKAPFGKTAPHLMRSAEEAGQVNAQAWSTPNSMREVEPSAAFRLKRIEKKGSNDGNDR